MKEFADDDFKLDENGRKLSKRAESTVGKGEIARYEQFLLFPRCFQETFPTVFSRDLNYRHVKTRACLGKGYLNFVLFPKFSKKLLTQSH